MAFCRNCGAEINDNAVICINCGAETDKAKALTAPSNAGQSDWTVALLLCIFLGAFGIHRFYVGKTGTGLIWLFTLGCFGIGALVDLITICTGSFTDVNGHPLHKR